MISPTSSIKRIAAQCFPLVGVPLSRSGLRALPACVYSQPPSLRALPPPPPHPTPRQPTPWPDPTQIPTANDIPIDFRVTLLRNAPCERTPMVHSSKAVGEPPFFLGELIPRCWHAGMAAIVLRQPQPQLQSWQQQHAAC